MNSLYKRLQFKVNDFVDMLTKQTLEQNDIIDTIQEFRAEGAFQSSLNHRITVGVFIVYPCCRTKANARSEFSQLTGSNIGCHDDHRISEINLSSETICHLTVVQRL